MNGADLAAEIDALVAVVPGVTRVFSVDPAVLRAARRLLSSSSASGLPLSSVEVGPTGLSVRVSIGTAAEVPPLETGARVAAAIRARSSG